MLNKIREYITKRKWIKAGKPLVYYDGFNCGCCGRWINKKYSVPEYLSMGFQFDTWGLCDSCKR